MIEKHLQIAPRAISHQIIHPDPNQQNHSTSKQSSQKEIPFSIFRSISTI
jgi:hypothetical protein